MENWSRQRVRDQVAHMAFEAETRPRGRSIQMGQNQTNTPVPPSHTQRRTRAT